MPPKKTRSSIASAFSSGKRSTGPASASTSAAGKAKAGTAAAASVTAGGKGKRPGVTKEASPVKLGAEEAALENARRNALARFPDAPTLNPQDRRFDGYWKLASKKMGRPVHGEGLNRIHHMLRVFDMDPTFGPCMGLTRLERWHRAKDDFEEDPPEAVRIILETREGLALDEYKLPVYSSTFGGWGL